MSYSLGLSLPTADYTVPSRIAGEYCPWFPNPTTSLAVISIPSYNCPKGCTEINRWHVAYPSPGKATVSISDRRFCSVSAQ